MNRISSEMTMAKAGRCRNFSNMFLRRVQSKDVLEVAADSLKKTTRREAAAFPCGPLHHGRGWLLSANIFLSEFHRSSEGIIQRGTSSWRELRWGPETRISPDLHREPAGFLRGQFSLQLPGLHGSQKCHPSRIRSQFPADG